MSRPYAEVIGDPIAHSKSPLIHGFWLEALGIEADYRAYHVRPDELAGYLAARRADPDWRGCNVTIPHKQAVLPLLDRVEPQARRAGAVNTIVRADDGALTGTNTDIDGIAEAIAGAPSSPTGGSGESAVVIGAGGAARAAFALFAQRGTAVRIVARNSAKAEDAARACGLDAEILPFSQVAEALEGAPLLVNATQLGMTGQSAMPDPVIAALDRLAPRALVFDMVYAPLETALLRAARGHGRGVSDGLVMLVGQAAVAFERFFGQPPPRARDAELRARLIA